MLIKGSIVTISLTATQGHLNFCVEFYIFSLCPKTKLLLGMNECVPGEHGALKWTGITHRVYSCINTRVPGVMVPDPCQHP